MMVVIVAMVMVMIVVMVMIMIVVVMVVAVMMTVVMVAIRAADMILVTMLQELRIVLQRPLQVEGTLVQDFGEIDAGTARLVDACAGVDGPNDVLDLRQLVRRHEIGLVDDHDVGEGDLVLGLAAVLQAERQVLGVD